jgi:hypothetical protein
LSSPETISRLLEIIEICDIHLNRLNYAKNHLTVLFPLDNQAYNSLEDSDITLIDQMIYRYTKLQDTMGSKLFPLTLKSLGEDYTEKPFIDVLNRLEKLELIPDQQEWMMMREIRNQLSHEYPSETAETIEGLNNLFKNVETIGAIYTNLKSYLNQRFQA